MLSSIIENKSEFFLIYQNKKNKRKLIKNLKIFIIKINKDACIYISQWVVLVLTMGIFF
jgi:hypothetical protein